MIGGLCRLPGPVAGSSPSGRKAVALLRGSLVLLSTGRPGSHVPRPGQPSLPELGVVVREVLGVPEFEGAEDWIPAEDAGMTGG